MPKRDPSQFEISKVTIPPTTKELVAEALAAYRRGDFRSYRKAAVSILERCYPGGVGTAQQKKSKTNYLASKISKLDRSS